MYVTEPVSDSLTRDCPQCKAKTLFEKSLAKLSGVTPSGFPFFLIRIRLRYIVTIQTDLSQCSFGSKNINAPLS